MPSFGLPAKEWRKGACAGSKSAGHIRQSVLFGPCAARKVPPLHRGQRLCDAFLIGDAGDGGPGGHVFSPTGNVPAALFPPKNWWMRAKTDSSWTLIQTRIWPTSSPGSTMTRTSAAEWERRFRQVPRRPSASIGKGGGGLYSPRLKRKSTSLFARPAFWCGGGAFEDRAGHVALPSNARAFRQEFFAVWRCSVCLSIHSLPSCGVKDEYYRRDARFKNEE